MEDQTEEAVAERLAMIADDYRADDYRAETGPATPPRAADLTEFEYLFSQCGTL